VTVVTLERWLNVSDPDPAPAQPIDDQLLREIIQALLPYDSARITKATLKEALGRVAMRRHMPRDDLIALAIRHRLITVRMQRVDVHIPADLLPQRVRLVALRDLPQFIAEDLNCYGPYRAGEVMLVPPRVGSTLLYRGWAKQSEEVV